MNLLDGKFFKLFLRPLLVTLLICVFLFLLADFFGLAEDFLTNQPPLGKILEYFLYRLFYATFFLLPLAALIGGFWGLNHWRVTRQWTAVLNSGVSPPALLRLPIAFLVLLSLCAILMNIHYVPGLTRKANRLRDYAIKNREKSDPTYRDFHLNLAGGGTLKVGYFDPEKKLMKDLLLTRRSRQRLRVRIDAERAVFSSRRGWQLVSPTVRKFKAPGEFETTGPDSYVVALESPGVLRQIINANPRKSERHPEEFSTGELRSAIKFRRRRGMNVTAESIYYHWKFSYPLGIFVFGLLGMYLAVETNLNRPAGIGISLLLAFVYWILFNVALAFGKAGYFSFLPAFLAPYLAAYLAPASFLLAVFLVHRYRT